MGSKRPNHGMNPKQALEQVPQQAAGIKPSAARDCSTYQFATLRFRNWSFNNSTGIRRVYSSTQSRLWRLRHGYLVEHLVAAVLVELDVTSRSRVFQRIVNWLTLLCSRPRDLSRPRRYRWVGSSVFRNLFFLWYSWGRPAVTKKTRRKYCSAPGSLMYLSTRRCPVKASHNPSG